jgi:hypothetical protein
LAFSFGIDEAVCVWTGVGVALSTILMVAMIAHALRIMLLIRVRTLENLGCLSLDFLFGQ